MGVMGLLMPVAGLIKVRYRGRKADIDSPFFKLHYRTTSTILFICCLLVTANNLIGKTIDCIGENIPGNVLNTYCWIMSTFSVPSKNAVGTGVDYPHQNVHPYVDGETEVVKHAYYQWVPFVLFLQGLMFYIPHYLWKIFEGQKLNKITNSLRGRTLALDQRKDQCDVLVKYIVDTLGMHNVYAFQYFLCDALNFANVVGQMYFVNRFLGGVFLTYGTDVIEWSRADAESRTDPLIDVFPRVTKCTFHKYGPSGTIERHDAMCVLALNIINEKIYVMLWFWFIALAVSTACYILYVLSVVLVPSMRRTMLERNAKTDDYREHVVALMRRAEIGDWFVLFLLSKNMDSVLFGEFVSRLAEKLKMEA